MQSTTKMIQLTPSDIKQIAKLIETEQGTVNLLGSTEAELKRILVQINCVLASKQ